MAMNRMKASFAQSKLPPPLVTSPIIFSFSQPETTPKPVVVELQAITDPQPAEEAQSASLDVDLPGCLSFDKLRTQKARGIKFVDESFSRGGVYRQTHLIYSVQALVECPHLVAFLRNLRYNLHGTRDGTIYARPCPRVPRHGFVDSRCINDTKDLLHLLDEIRAAEEPDAEIAFTAFYPATSSAIWTPGHLTLGGGNDGATAGKECVTLPIRTDWQWPIFRAPSMGEIVPSTLYADTPYLETVSQNTHTLVVQLRGGPACAEFGPDFIPYSFPTRRVVKAEGSLLEWEALCRSLRTEERVVVDHAGGSLSSHYGVHCLLHRIPIMTSRHPKEYEYLRKTVDQERQFPVSPASVAQGILSASPTLSFQEAAWLVLFVVHNPTLALPGATDPAPRANLLGQGLAYGALLGLCAIAGEFRHRQRRRQTSGPPSVTQLPKDRKEVHTLFWTNPKDGFSKLYAWRHAFANARWKKGYGGQKWADCADVTIKLVEEIQGLLTMPSTLRVQSSLSTLNQFINTVHNNGSMFDKYISPPLLDGMAQGRLNYMLPWTHVLWKAVQHRNVRGRAESQSWWRLSLPKAFWTRQLQKQERCLLQLPSSKNLQDEVHNERSASA